jgi:pimeloyl-ACP methyl ester carboxylesterase
VQRYRSRGFTVFALGWPGLDGTVEELRADPTPLTQLNIEKIVDYFDAFIRRLEAPPILIGHSCGGLFAQLLAYRGLGSAVVAIEPGAPAGVPELPFSTLKASAPVLANPLNIGNATMLRERLSERELGRLGDARLSEDRGPGCHQFPISVG